MLTPQQERYCQARARGLTQRQAYREAYPSSVRWKDASVDAKASALESTDKVRIRLRGLQDAAATMAKVSRAAVLERLAELNEEAHERARRANGDHFANTASAAVRSSEALLKYLPEDDPGQAASFVADFALLIGPAFLRPHRLIAAGGVTDLWMSGGRGSLKSSFAALEVVKHIETHPDQHALVLMRYKNSLRDSAYAQVVWAIGVLGLEDDYELPESTLRIRKKSTSQLILFRGCDNPKKIKSVKVPFGYLGMAWYEEADMFRGMAEIRSVNQSLTRGGSSFVRLYTFNPPRSRSCWINRHVDELRDRGVEVFSSTYLEAPPEWLGEQFIADAEALRDSDPQAYEHEYMGVPVGTGGSVFDRVTFREVTDEEIDAFDRLRCGQDFGWFPDPWAFTMSEWQPGRRVLITWYEDSANKLQPAEQAKRIRAALTWSDDGRTEAYHHAPVLSDDADPTAIAAQRDAGVNARAAGKGNMRAASYRFLQSVEWVIDPARCPRLAREVREMEYERNADGEWLNSIPDGDDHAIDSVRYAMMREARSRRAYRRETPAR